MDKKIYFEPEMEVVNLKLQGMLCGSPSGTDEGGSGTSTGNIDEDEAEGF